MWTQRDQFTGEQLPIADQQLILDQHHRRLAANDYLNQKQPNQETVIIPEGSLVYIHQVGEKQITIPPSLYRYPERRTMVPS